MMEQEGQPDGQSASEGAPLRQSPQGASPPPQVRKGPQPTLKCPFCSGKRFDYGRDVFAGPNQLMYCRQTPARGQHPEEGINLPMKGAVCMDCGYVAMMVDINQLYAPIRRPRDAASVLSRRAGAAAHLARSPEEEAAEALERMKCGEAVTSPGPPGPAGRAVPPKKTVVPQAPRPAAPGIPAPSAASAAEDDFGDLDRLLAQAERDLGLDGTERER